MGHKVVETIHRIKMHLVQELLITVHYSDGSKFCKGDANPEDEEHSGQPWKVDNNLEQHQTDPLCKTSWEVAQEFNTDHSTDLWRLKQVRKVKKLGKWVPNELTANQKKKNNVIFEVPSLLILCNNNEPFLNQIVAWD